MDFPAVLKLLSMPTVAHLTLATTKMHFHPFCLIPVTCQSLQVPRSQDTVQHKTTQPHKTPARFTVSNGQRKKQRRNICDVQMWFLVLSVKIVVNSAKGNRENLMGQVTTFLLASCKRRKIETEWWLLLLKLTRFSLMQGCGSAIQ